MDVQALIERYPTLYHMAERDTWSSIKARGLLSTSAVLDLYGVKGQHRLAFEREHRPEKVTVGPPGDQIIIRDQKPMPPSRLAVALPSCIAPPDWYHFLNSKVFMWAEEHRLFGLLNARHYRNLEHDVLTIDTASLVAAHGERVWLCPMNSGSAFRVPQRRNFQTFQRIRDYPSRKRSNAPAKEVVEVVVDYSIPDIVDHVEEVRRIRSSTVLHQVPV